jgi:hypothetical protein
MRLRRRQPPSPTVAVSLPARSLSSCCRGRRAQRCEVFDLVRASLILCPQRDSNPCCRLERAKS